MFERLVGTISGLREGIEEAAAAKKREAARTRKEKREAATVTKAAAKKTSKEKLGRSKTAKRLVGLGAAVISTRDAALEKGQELHQKIKVDDPDAKLAALVGTTHGQTQQQEQSPQSSVLGRGGLPPI